MRICLIAVVLSALPATAAIVDRIAIAAGNRIITDSEIQLRIRLTAFQNGEKPDFNLRKSAAERLIDQKLVEREMDVGHYPRLNEEARKQLLLGFAKTNYKADMETLRRALLEYGLTLADLEDDLARQSDLLTFLSLRFRPAVQVSDGDVLQVFRKMDSAASLNDFRARIEEQITNDRADSDMNTWLKDQRARTKIVYLETELAP